jgi:hypothetical protein
MLLLLAPQCPPSHLFVVKSSSGIEKSNAHLPNPKNSPSPKQN